MKEDSFEFDITKYKKFSSDTFQFPSVVTLDQFEIVFSPTLRRILKN
jgi:hypothetical protein